MPIKTKQLKSFALSVIMLLNSFGSISTVFAEDSASISESSVVEMITDNESKEQNTQNNEEEQTSATSETLLETQDEASITDNNEPAKSNASSDNETNYEIATVSETLDNINVTSMTHVTCPIPNTLELANEVFTLSNGKIGLCIENRNCNPPVGKTSTKVYELDNANLRKISYYGYGGPGNILTAYGDGAACITSESLSYQYSGTSVCLLGYTYQERFNDFIKPKMEEMLSKPDPIQYGYKIYAVEFEGSDTSWRGETRPFQKLLYGVQPRYWAGAYKQDNFGNCIQDIKMAFYSYTGDKPSYDDLVSSDGKAKISGLPSGVVYVGTGTTNAEGQTQVETTGNAGKFCVVETEVPSQYTTNKNVFDVVNNEWNIKQDTTNSAVIENNLRTWIGAYKQDEKDNFIEGIDMSFYSYDGDKPSYEQLTTKDGKVKTDNLPEGVNYLGTNKTNESGYAWIETTGKTGKFCVIETDVPLKYSINKTVFDAQNNIWTEEVSTANSPVIVNKDAQVNVQVKKESSNPEITDGNECYSLAGAEYGIYSDKDATQLLKTLITDENGDSNQVTLSLGTYYIKEIKAPKGFQLDKRVHKITLTEADVSTAKVFKTKDAPGRDIKPKEFIKIALGSLLKEPKSLEGTIFEVKYYDVQAKSADDLKNVTATKTWYIHPLKNEKGQYSALIDEKHLTSFNGKQSDSLYIDEETGLTIFPVGTLTIQEVQSADGYLKDNATIKSISDENEANITNDGLILINISNVNGNYIATSGSEYEIGNYVTTVDISKTTVTGEDELPGAKLQITDKDGKVFEEWESGEKPHHVEGLKPGEEYTLTETIAPNGYVIATSIKFSVEFDSKGNTIVKENGNVVDKIVMKDKQITVSKSDVAGEEVKDAEMSVTDENGKVVDKWTSDGTDHKISGLEEGKSYVIHEVVAPDGYVKATDIPFTASTKKENQHYDVVDKIVTFTKKDAAGEDANEVEGAEIEVTDENGKVVDKWASTTEEHKISGLEVGKTYTMTETQAPDGYYYSESIEFTVTEDGVNQTVEMIDHPIRYAIAKIDDIDGSYVKGVKLKLTDITGLDAEQDSKGVEVALPNNGITTEEPFLLDKELIAGHTYLLEEAEMVGGVYKATSIQFTVPKVGTPDVTTITMIDNTTGVSVRKVDNYGNPCSGAKLAIYETAIDEEGNISILQDEEGNNVLAKSEDGTLAQFESTDDIKGIDVSKFVIGGKTYILREEETPFGFKQSPDVVFTVTGTKDEHQNVMMTDARDTLLINIVKVDSFDKSKKLEGAEFTLYTKDGKIAKDINGKDCIATTGKDGIVEWKVEYNSDYSGYFVKETKAPQGYILDEKSHEITVPEDYDFEKPLTFTIENTLKPENPDTSASGSLMAYMAAAGVSAMAIVFVLKRKKSEAK